MLQHGTPAGALAVSLPYARGGVRITVFFDRVADYANCDPLFMPRFLGHVLAHEIGRVLRGTNAHSLTGVMKAHWDRDDYFAMRVKIIGSTLATTPGDDRLASGAQPASDRGLSQRAPNFATPTAIAPTTTQPQPNQSPCRL